MWMLLSRSKLSNHKSNCVTPLVKALQWPPILIRIKAKVLIVPCKVLVAAAKLWPHFPSSSLSYRFSPFSLFQNSAAKMAFFLFFDKPLPITGALYPVFLCLGILPSRSFPYMRSSLLTLSMTSTIPST